MKSYLDLVPISAKVHRKQNRMSIICIVLAVFLVTAIFGMADMFIRGQILQAQQENGNWHIGIQNISDEDAMLISSRPEVATVADYGTLNFRGEQEYTLHGKNVSICGGNDSIVTEIFNVLDEKFKIFLENLHQDDLKAEYLLPTIIGDLLKEDLVDVTVLKSQDNWFGVTYKEDKQSVINSIKELIINGVYPNKLY